MKTYYNFDTMFKDLLDLGTIASQHPMFKDAQPENYKGILATTYKSYEDKFVVMTEIPGLTEDDLSIEFKDNTLTITADYKDQDDLYIRSGKWMCSHKFKEIDPENISAKLDNGILSVTLNKKPESQPIKINIGK